MDIAHQERRVGLVVGMEIRIDPEMDLDSTGFEPAAVTAGKVLWLVAFLEAENAVIEGAGLVFPPLGMAICR